VKIACSICGRLRERNDAHIVTLTPEELAEFEREGQKVAPEYAYCKPCHRMLSDPNMATQFVKGLVQIHFQGSANAERAAEKFRNRLIEKMRPQGKT
jgi:hypothetical protein